MIIINGHGRTSYGYLISVVKVFSENDHEMKEEIYAPVVMINEGEVYYQIPNSGEVQKTGFQEYINGRRMIYTHSYICSLFEDSLKPRDISEVYYVHRDGADSVLSLIKSHSAKNSRYGSCGAAEEDMYACSYILSSLFHEWRRHMMSIMYFKHIHPEIKVHLLSFEELTITKEREIMAEIAQRYNSSVDVDAYLKKLKGEMDNGGHFFNKGIKKNKAEVYLDDVNRHIAENICCDILFCFGYRDKSWLDTDKKTVFLLGADEYGDEEFKYLLTVSKGGAEIMRASDVKAMPEDAVYVYAGKDAGEMPEGCVVYPYYRPYFSGEFYIFDMSSQTKALMKDVSLSEKNLIISYKKCLDTDEYIKRYMMNKGMEYDEYILDSEYDTASADKIDLSGYDSVFISLYDEEKVTNTNRYQNDTAQHRRMIKYLCDRLKNKGVKVYSYFPFFG